MKPEEVLKKINFSISSQNINGQILKRYDHMLLLADGGEALYSLFIWDDDPMALWSLNVSFRETKQKEFKQIYHEEFETFKELIGSEHFKRDFGQEILKLKLDSLPENQ